MHLREVCIPEKGASFFFLDFNLPGQTKSGFNISWLVGVLGLTAL